MIIDAYNNVPEYTLNPSSKGIPDTLDVGKMNVGFGDKSFKADESGIWLGADAFADAVFSVDMDGNLIASSATFTQFISKTGTNQPMSGTIRLGTGTGDASIILDGANKRIIINDGSHNRVLIGYQSGGF